MSERAAPFYCPYCGEEDLRPFGETHGQWRCANCVRVFTLKYVGSAPERPGQLRVETGLEQELPGHGEAKHENG